MCSLSHQNATCKVLEAKLKYFDPCKKYKSDDKCYVQMLYLFLFLFHRRSTVIPFRMKIVKHACYANKNIYIKKIRIFKFYLLYILNLLFIREHLHLRAKTALPEIEGLNPTPSLLIYLF
jgi:hypothetical protein